MNFYKKIDRYCSNRDYDKLCKMIVTDRTLFSSNLGFVFTYILKRLSEADVTIQNYLMFYNALKSHYTFNNTRFWYSVMDDIYAYDFNTTQIKELFMFIHTKQLVVENLDDVWDMIYRERMPKFPTTTLTWLYMGFVEIGVDIKMPLFDCVRDRIVSTHKEWLSMQSPDIQLLFL